MIYPKRISKGREDKQYKKLISDVPKDQKMAFGSWRKSIRSLQKKPAIIKPKNETRNYTGKIMHHLLQKINHIGNYGMPE